MKKSFIIPIIFALVGTSFVSYSFLDTFIIPKNAKSVSFNYENLDAPLGPIVPSTSQPQSSSASSQSSVSSSTSTPVVQQKQYYEDLTAEQIASLFTQNKTFVEKKHYSDSDIYIDITTHRDSEDTTTYYVADIRINNMKFFRTAFAEDKYVENGEGERTSDICKRHKGILAIDGDTYGQQEAGYVIRNKTTYRRTKNLSRKKDEDLAIYDDGTFEIIDENNTSIESLEAKGAREVFSFGPGLINAHEVTVTPKDEVGTALSGNRNQRCAIGIIAPGHYCFVVSDGRNKDSSGISLYTLANIMKDLHCETAYNLDGGGSATMYLDDGTGNANGLGHLINVPGQLQGDSRVQQRKVSDIVYIGKDE